MAFDLRLVGFLEDVDIAFEVAAFVVGVSGFVAFEFGVFGDVEFGLVATAP